MEQIIVGTYDMGWESVEIVLREGTGVEFFLIPETGRGPRIKVGADQNQWSDVVAVLLHECLELEYERAGVRFSPSSELARDHAAYIFVLNHAQFSEAAARVAELLSKVLPDLAKSWKQWNKRKG